ncbi:uncharacterized protein TRIADDRAFT_53519 [Trichoplax adhaerens]|uniref:Ethylmalonyl-CoA decarboxylase n=1 Tax=Trichoplax adhaerens TaxID=10228 RepID=B3RPF8_TRIAD|nr:hypothetical protein TRIADDRAFT_53519 [Trichoplax adhaerens]EDV28183.1 hypothetical protein TRIADDRAFT_53519 [Trichoplax adhaerens]|eukprot:XP_002110017.1 hypothetical protein TRIADDRAFT_53519 [Trichoplax adhaerens]
MWRFMSIQNRNELLCTVNRISCVINRKGCYRHLSRTSVLSVTDNTSIIQQLQKVEGGKIKLEKFDDSKIAVLTIDNERIRNALSGSMMVQLRDAINQLEEWKEGKGVILIGASSTFCSGADLNLAKQFNSPEHGEAMCELMQTTLTRLKRLPMISLAVIEGKALGGGAELTTACDFRLISKNAEIRFVHVKRGVTPGWGGGSRLVNIVGRRMALRLLAGSIKITAKDALQYGLADDIISSDQVTLHAGMNWLKKIIDGPVNSIRGIKQIVTYADDLGTDQALQFERSVFTTVWGAPALMESLETKKKY